MAEETKKELPDECWAIIFKNLNRESNQESVSLVCKRFLSITNSSRVSIKVLSPSIQLLSKLLQRFSNLKKIQLSCFPGDLSEAVHAVAQSGLDLEELDLSCSGSLQAVCLEELGSKMQNLKVLKCALCLEDADLVRIANSLAQLDELQIGKPYFMKDVMTVSDEGIHYLSSKLKRLRKIDLTHNFHISDKSLVSLSSNCAFLEHITVSFCHKVTKKGISFLINNSQCLKFLHIDFNIESFGVKSSPNFLQKLQTLRLTHADLSDEILYSIADAQIPLTELSLIFCKSYTFSGILRLLQSYQSLTSLVIKGAEFLTNEHIECLSSFLENLRLIKLHSCPELSDSAFVTLTQRCPLLCHLEMRDTSLSIKEYNYEGLMKNLAIKYLKLSSKSYLSTSVLKRLLNICPKVEKIKLYHCFLRGEELDVADILECNKGILKKLVLEGCQRLKVSTKDENISNLEMLIASDSGINDELLGKMCPGLVHLNLENCRNVTEAGVKEVVKSCRRLRFLSLSACTNLDISIIEWIVNNSQSLRKLVSPSDTYPDENNKPFLPLGCLVSRGYAVRFL